MQPQKQYTGAGVHAVGRAEQQTSDRRNITFMRAFVRLRQMLETNEELNRKFASVVRNLSTHDNFRVVFDELKKLTEEPLHQGRQIGFKIADETGRI